MDNKQESVNDNYKNASKDPVINSRTKIDGKTGKAACPKYLRVVIATMVAVLIIFLVTNFLGFFTITFKKPSQSVIVVTNVCDESVVQRFTKAVYSGAFLDPEKTKEIVNEVKQKKNAEQDPTCIGMITYDAIARNDTEAAKKNISLLKEYRKQGVYMNDGVAIFMSTPFAESMVTSGRGGTRDVR